MNQRRDIICAFAEMNRCPNFKEKKPVEIKTGAEVPECIHNQDDVCKLKINPKK